MSTRFANAKFKERLGLAEYWRVKNGRIAPRLVLLNHSLSYKRRRSSST